MPTSAHARLAAACLAVCLLSAAARGAPEPPLTLIAHPRRATALSEADVRAIYLKQKRFWSDGRAIVPINREAGTPARERFSERIFGEGSRRLAGYWNQRYFEAGEFPPATLASDDAVLRFVAANEDAVGYVTGDVTDGVAVVLVLR
jgi:hypothetical protein